jgi:hypothetical protein
VGVVAFLTAFFFFSRFFGLLSPMSNSSFRLYMKAILLPLSLNLPHFLLKYNPRDDPGGIQITFFSVSAVVTLKYITIAPKKVK